MHSSIPQLRQAGNVTQLYVDDEPYLVLGGELGNSTASDLMVLEDALEKCARMNLNTVMLPVYWDLIEPEEGRFDFSLVHGAIDLARARGLRLVLLWFGTWKNCMSCYAPGWVKRDTARFARVQRKDGQLEEIISPTSVAAREADSKAFAALMRWIREYDTRERTVIMVQVENEIGMIPEARDHSPDAQRAYESDVPEALLRLATTGQLGAEVGALWDNAGRKTKGSWAEVFGADARGEEVFAACKFATYVEKIAAAGKREYSLPMFVNAALIRPGYQPGQYASGGPLPHLLEVWRAGAPSLDMLSPDIYFPNFMHWARRYVRSGDPIFIPEMAASMRATGNIVWSIAQCGAIGVGPFAIENVDADKERLIADCYAALSGMSEQILKSQRDGEIIGLTPEIAFDWSVEAGPVRGELGWVVFEASFERPSIGGDTQTTTLPTLGAGRWDAPPGTPLGAAMDMQVASEEFVILGMGVTITFAPADGTGRVGIDRVHEGRFSDGAWPGGRWLNGDETHQGRHLRFGDGRWTVQRVTLYRY